ncbi:ComA [Acrasis kona]|uniref:ComA n=1 Tax=Acrasis kona TaxID=1008807 RepID=A0AAW2YN32_9EUKA
MATFKDRACSFLPLNNREQKPRSSGLTEVRGPYYSSYGKRHLEDLLETMGMYIDILKFAGGSFALMPKDVVIDLNKTAHNYNTEVSTGGFIERVLSYGPQYVDQYLTECKELGFDIVEVSSGFISLPTKDVVSLVNKVQDFDLKPKPEVGIQFGAGGGITTSAEHESEGTKSVSQLINQGRKCLEAGAWRLMIESEGITEQVTKWRTDVIAEIVDNFGLERVMFEAADPEVFEWYIKNFGIDVNLFVDHSQIVQLESLRSGTWGSKSSWGRITSYKPTL